MPYIKLNRRADLDLEVEKLSKNIESSGEFCYCVYRLMIDLLEKWGKTYSTMAGLVGVLQTAAFEFYRKEVAPYEDEKIKENGDVK